MTDPAYWEARWREGRTGFHEGRVNAALARAWPELGVPAGAAVFVPLCGKAVDLAWLAARPQRVVGVEVSELAVRAFFAEQGMEPSRRVCGAFECWSDRLIALLRGDFFALDAGLLEAAAGGGPCAGWWDRAALIALPPALRRRYVQHLATLLPAGARGLLLTLETPQAPEVGPPFAVLEEEVRALFSAPEWREPRLLERQDVTAEMRARGREDAWVRETLYALERI